MRIIGLLAVVAILVTACSASDGAEPSMTPETESEIYAAAVVVGCSDRPNRQMFVHDRLFAWGTLEGNGQPMPQQIHDAIASEFPTATFVAGDETDALFVDGIVVNDGVIVSVGPIEKFAPDVVGLPIGVVFARDGGFAGIVQFKWDGDSWEHATSEETGVTVTTAVS